MNASKKTVAHYAIAFFFLLGSTHIRASWFSKKPKDTKQYSAYFTKEATFEKIGALIGKINRRERPKRFSKINLSSYIFNGVLEQAKKESQCQKKELAALCKQLEPLDNINDYHFQHYKRDMARMYALEQYMKKRVDFQEPCHIISKKFKPARSGKYGRGKNAIKIKGFNLEKKLGNQLTEQTKALKKLTGD